MPGLTPYLRGRLVLCDVAGKYRTNAGFAQRIHILRCGINSQALHHFRQDLRCGWAPDILSHGARRGKAYWGLLGIKTCECEVAFFIAMCNFLCCIANLIIHILNLTLLANRLNCKHDEIPPRNGKWCSLLSICPDTISTPVSCWSRECGTVACCHECTGHHFCLLYVRGSQLWLL